MTRIRVVDVDTYTPPDDTLKRVEAFIGISPTHTDLRVRLLSNEPVGVAATSATLGALWPNSRVLTNEDGTPVLDAEGFARVRTTNPDFLRFAMVRQGYVREVL